MSFLPTYTRAQIAQLSTEEYSSASTIPADTSAGSGLSSIFNAKALVSVGIFQQQLIYVASIVRLSTIAALQSGAANPDVDSFVNAFGVFRQQAQASTGQVVFSTSSTLSQPILIPAVALGSTSGGVIVQTTTGVQFQVVIDTANANYNAALGGYQIPAGATGGSVSVTVQCLSDGTSGNVAANQISQIFSGPGVTSVAGIGSVTNPAPFTNAAAVETDNALKIRFAQQMSTGITATSAASAAAILGVQLGLTYSVGDGLNASGAAQSSYYTVVVNNAGVATAPTTTLLTAVYKACLAVKPLGISFQVIAPTLVPVNLVCNVKVAPGYTAAAVVAACTTNFQTLMNNVGLDPAGAPTSAKIAAVYATLYNTAGVSDITSLTLNGGTVDVPAAFAHQIVAGTVAASPY